MRITRDKAGRVKSVGEGEIESMMHLEIDRQPATGPAEVADALREVLDDVRDTLADWPAMPAKMLEIVEDIAHRRMPVDEDGRQEAQAFLRWGAADHFTFLGYREYKVKKQGGKEVRCV